MGFNLIQHDLRRSQSLCESKFIFQVWMLKKQKVCYISKGQTKLRSEVIVRFLLKRQQINKSKIKVSTEKGNL